MPPVPPGALTPVLVPLGTREFDSLRWWPYDDPFVTRLLENDIPQRVQFGDCHVWLYQDAAGQPVGFGSLDVCDDYGSLTGGRAHPYIPLLAKNPSATTRGVGEGIVRHLIGEAALLAAQPGRCHDVLYLACTPRVRPPFTSTPSADSKS